jgi:hypothetical protein
MPASAESTCTMSILRSYGECCHAGDMTDPEVLADLDRALAAAEAVVVGVQDGQWAAPTPCTELDVRDVIGHLVSENLLFAAVVGGESLPEAALIILAAIRWRPFSGLPGKCGRRLPYMEFWNRFTPRHSGAVRVRPSRKMIKTADAWLQQSESSVNRWRGLQPRWMIRRVRGRREPSSPA